MPVSRCATMPSPLFSCRMSMCHSPRAPVEVNPEWTRGSPKSTPPLFYILRDRQTII